jgi:uncharacterized protein (TIGR01777 family)
MHVYIAGGTGFIGKCLTKKLLEQGNRVTATGTRSNFPLKAHPRLSYVQADLTRKGRWQESLAEADAVVNLVGKTIFGRWTKAYKAQIRESRILTTHNIVESLESSRQGLLINASAVGFYGSQGDTILDEDAPPGSDFLGEVGMGWESAALEGEKKGIRVVCARFGIVLGEEGGAVNKMLAPFKFFIGGPLGNGEQWFSWIHIDDLCAAMIWVTEHQELKGPVNFCAPNPVRNKEMTKIIGRILGRPTFIPTPAFAIRMVMGELASALLSSQRCVPKKLVSADFQYTYPDIESAFREILKK